MSAYVTTPISPYLTTPSPAPKNLLKGFRTLSRQPRAATAFFGRPTRRREPQRTGGDSVPGPAARHRGRAWRPADTSTSRTTVLVSAGKSYTLAEVTFDWKAQPARPENSRAARFGR